LSQSKGGLNPINPNSTAASINPKASSATQIKEQTSPQSSIQAQVSAFLNKP